MMDVGSTKVCEGSRGLPFFFFFFSDTGTGSLPNDIVRRLRVTSPACPVHVRSWNTMEHIPRMPTKTYQH